jgi:hypothetical protein
MLQEASGGPPGSISHGFGAKFTDEEMAIAKKLYAEGKHVMKLGESVIDGVKRGDFFINGFRFELKTLGANATAGTLKNDIAKAVGQGGGNVLIDARNAAGITFADAQKAAARVFGADSRLQVVRIIGKTFDIVIKREAGRWEDLCLFKQKFV